MRPEQESNVSVTVPGHSATRTPLKIEIPVSVGELVDKISILEIKQSRLEHAEKRGNVERELQALYAAYGQHIPRNPSVIAWGRELKVVNQKLWELEETLRSLESQEKFEAAFVASARLVYRYNDERARIKRAINQELGSFLIEEKSY